MAIPVALSIAGSDSSGGAGIQADLKTFAALRVYGASVVTALTAQNTRGVTGIHPVPPTFVTAQLEAVFSDLDVAVVKIETTGLQAITFADSDKLRRRRMDHQVRQFEIGPGRLHDISLVVASPAETGKQYIGTDSGAQRHK